MVRIFLALVAMISIAPVRNAPMIDIALVFSEAIAITHGICRNSSILNPMTRSSITVLTCLPWAFAMAVDKLAEGIRLFAQDQEKLEALLAARLATQKGTADASA